LDKDKIPEQNQQEHWNTKKGDTNFLRLDTQVIFG
jgi:hypothetical protein